MPPTADGSHWQAPNMNVHNAYYTRYHRGHLSSLVISSHLRDYDCCAVIYGRLTFSRGGVCHVIVSELETICGQQSFVSRLQLISRDSSEPSRDREKETAAASYLSDNLTASRPLPDLPSSPQPSSSGRRKTLDKTFFVSWAETRSGWAGSDFEVRSDRTAQVFHGFLWSRASRRRCRPSSVSSWATVL